jgi:hypothetical protein
MCILYPAALRKERQGRISTHSLSHSSWICTASIRPSGTRHSVLWSQAPRLLSTSNDPDNISLNSPPNSTIQKEDSPSHQNVGKCMEY